MLDAFIIDQMRKERIDKSKRPCLRIGDRCEEPRREEKRHNKTERGIEIIDFSI